MANSNLYTLVQQHKVLIAPSLLSSDFVRLEQEIRRCERGGADLLHIDVMDGHFVPNITIGIPVVRAIRRITHLPLDCHLMITSPERYVEAFAEAGADAISVHAEVSPHLHRTLQQIRSTGAAAGLVLNPLTPLQFAFEAAEFCDYILMMSVNPGFGGQKFISAVLRRIEQLAAFLEQHQLLVPIEVDGGIDPSNAEAVVRAGASILVSGTSIFRDGKVEQNIAALRDAALKALPVA